MHLLQLAVLDPDATALVAGIQNHRGRIEVAELAHLCSAARTAFLARWSDGSSRFGLNLVVDRGHHVLPAAAQIGKLALVEEHSGACWAGVEHQPVEVFSFQWRCAVRTFPDHSVSISSECLNRAANRRVTR